MPAIRRASSQGPAHHKTTPKSLLDELSRLRLYPQEIEMDGEPRAQGGQGEITCATLKRPHQEQVAVKSLRYRSRDDGEKLAKDFVSEVNILSRLSHRNIVKLLGFVEDLENHIAWMVFPWEKNGDLQHFLATRQCDHPERISLVKDVVAGVEYLHTRVPPICHGDLKSLNILVNSSCRALITDFGSARIRKDRAAKNSVRRQGIAASRVKSRNNADRSQKIDISSTGNQLALSGPCWSFRWAAPEVIFGEDPDLPSDMWALGWVIWEVITQKIPFHDLPNDTAITMTLHAQVELVAGDDQQLSQIAGLCSLVKDCLKYNPRFRPTAARCSSSIGWMPSAHPSTETSSEGKDRSASLLLHMGYAEYTQHNHTKAAALFSEALERASSANEALASAEASTWMGEVLLSQGKHYEAEQYFLEAVDRHVCIGNERGRAHALSGLGGVFQARERHDKAIELYSQAMEIYTSARDEAGRADTLNSIAGAYRALGRNEEAIASFTAAKNIFSRIGNDRGLANSLSNLGNIHLSLSDWEQTVEHCVPAMRLHSRLGNRQGLAAAAVDLGSAYTAQLNYPEAEAAFVEALVNFLHLLDVKGSRDASRGLRYSRQRQDKITEGESLLARIRGESGASDSTALADAAYMLGSVCFQREDFKRAEEYLTQARKLYQTMVLTNASGLALTLLSFGDLHTAQHECASAETAYLQAIEEFIFIGQREGAVKTLGKLMCAILENDTCEVSARRELQERLSRVKDAPILSQNEPHFDIYIEISLLLGDVYLLRGETKPAARHFRRVEEFNLDVGNMIGLADVYIKLGHVYNTCKYFNMAERKFLGAIALYIRLRNRAGLIKALVGVAALAWWPDTPRDADLDNLLDRVTESTTEYSNMQDTEFFAAASLLIGRVFMRIESTIAEDMFSQALEDYKRTQNERGVASTLVHLGWMYSHICNRPEFARQFLDRAMEKFIELRDAAGFTSALTKLDKEDQAREQLSHSSGVGTLK